MIYFLSQNRIKFEGDKNTYVPQNWCADLHGIVRDFADANIRNPTKDEVEAICALSIDKDSDRTEFETGAFRDASANKINFKGHLSPLADEVAARYMHGHRKLPDGSLRAPDNWKKGMSLDSYIESLHRHFQDLRRLHDGLPARDGDDLFEVVGAIQFNINGYAHEIEKARIEAAGNPETDTARARPAA